jgi:hypothetical protein
VPHRVCRACGQYKGRAIVTKATGASDKSE